MSEDPFKSPGNELSATQRVGGGRYALLKQLGRGGMGIVWLALDERLGEKVALKFLPAEISSDLGALDDLRRETLRSRKLTHPNIIRIHDLHEASGEPAFISMEYVDGPNLIDLRVQRGERVLQWAELKPLVRQLCEALDYAHGELVIHRDLKPANMMLDAKGRLKLADFGIAATISDVTSRVSLKHASSGTLAYMSPQQMDGEKPKVTDDIYALGATLYELLTSRPPFFNGDVAYQARNLPPKAMDERLAEFEIQNEIPPDVAALIMACLAKDPEQRPQSARAVAEWIGLDLGSSKSLKGKSLFADEGDSRADSSGDSRMPLQSSDGEHAKKSAVGRGKILAAVAAGIIGIGAVVWLAFSFHTHHGANKSPAETVPPAKVSAVSSANASASESSGTTTSEPVDQTPALSQTDSKLKDKWSKALNNAVRDLQNNNDQDSVKFVSGILDSLDQPGGLAPAALTADGQLMKERVHALVQQGTMESAATLNWAQWQVLNQPGPGKSGPDNPNHKTGGAPGSGGLVLYLPFDKPDDDGVVHDESGAGNDGHVFGATWVPDGKFGGAYHFSITNITDRIVIPNSDTLNPDFITICAWIKAADTDGFWNRIVDKDFRNDYSLSLGGDYYGRAHRGKLTFETSRGEIETARALNDNRWHHVAAVYDGKAVQCYIDGAERSQQVKSPGPLRKSTWDLCIGNSVVDYGTGEFLAFDGLIDEVRIYNRALSPDEIKALASSQSSTVPVETVNTDWSSPKYGLYIHFGTPTFAKPGDRGQIPAERFAPPADMDVSAWIRTAKESGMTFAILTAKHESGFCLWDSPDYDYDVGSSPFKRDLIAEFIAACQAEGIVPGLHYSIPDAYNEGEVRYRGPVGAPYFNVIKKHFTELCSRYPDMRVLIVDVSQRLSGAQWNELNELVKRLDPQCALWGTADGGVQESHDVADTVNKAWMWSANAQLAPTQQLLATYNKAKAEDKSFLLNVGIDSSGRIPDAYKTVLMEMKTLTGH